MTPEEAERAKDNRKGWMDPLDMSYYLNDALATIAAQTWEWGLNLDGYTHWMNDREMAEDARDGIGAGRLVRRPVGPVEEVEE